MRVFDHILDRSTNMGASEPVRIGQPISELLAVAPSLRASHEAIQQRQQQETVAANLFYEVIVERNSTLAKDATLEDLIKLSPIGVESLLGDPTLTRTAKVLKAKHIKKKAKKSTIILANNGICYDTPDGAVAITVQTSKKVSKKKLKKLKKLKQKNNQAMRNLVTTYGHANVVTALEEL